MFDGGLPHDTMHDILEGIAPLEIKLLLSQLITNGLFTLGELNDICLNFNFGYSENDKPVTIFSQCLNNDTNKLLRATASQTLLLVQILLFLIVHKIPESKEHWSCFLLLRKITDIVLCPFKKVFCLSNYKNISLSLANRHQRWMRYELAAGTLLHTPLECSPARSGNGLNRVKDEPKIFTNVYLQLLN